MPLENFNYLDSLVPANPPISDGVVQGDDHLRGIKLALKNTFPNITGPVTATQDALNGAAGIFTSGAGVLADAGAMFKTNATDGFKNPLAGDIDVVLQGTVAATFQRTAGVNFFKFKGVIQADGEIKGPGITPIGGTIIWWDDVLPTDGMWAWANGQVIASANTVSPVLLARWGNRFGGNGVTTMGLPDLREVVPVGKEQMGGAASLGFLNNIVTGIKNTLHSFFGTAQVALTQAEMPSHYHTATIYDPGHTHSSNANASTSTTGGGGFQISAAAAATINAAVTGVRISSGNGFDTVNSTGGGVAHNNLQPSRIVNWIIRIG